MRKYVFHNKRIHHKVRSQDFGQFVMEMAFLVFLRNPVVVDGEQDDGKTQDQGEQSQMLRSCRQTVRKCLQWLEELVDVLHVRGQTFRIRLQWLEELLQINHFFAWIRISTFTSRSR